MRIVVGLVIAGGACSDSETKDPYCGNGHADPGEECDDPGVGNCSDTCTLSLAPITVDWTFQKHDGSDAMPCLPENSAITVEFAGHDNTLPCASGTISVPIQFSPSGAYDWSVTTTTDHVWTQSGTYIVGMPGVNAVFQTDVGDLHAVWSIDGGAMGDTCQGASITRIRLSADGVAFADLDCGLGSTIVEDVPIGAASVIAEGLDNNAAVLATSNPIDVTVLASASLDATFDLQVH